MIYFAAEVEQSACVWDDAGYGDRVTCSGDKVMFGLCGSGGTAKCDRAHAIQCCGKCMNAC